MELLRISWTNRYLFRETKIPISEDFPSLNSWSNSPFTEGESFDLFEKRAFAYALPDHESVHQNPESLANIPSLKLLSCEFLATSPQFPYNFCTTLLMSPIEGEQSFDVLLCPGLQKDDSEVKEIHSVWEFKQVLLAELRRECFSEEKVSVVVSEGREKLFQNFELNFSVLQAKDNFVQLSRALSEVVFQRELQFAHQSAPPHSIFKNQSGDRSTQIGWPGENIREKPLDESQGFLNLFPLLVFSLSLPSESGLEFSHSSTQSKDSLLEGVLFCSLKSLQSSETTLE